uniref:Uncharacterized protein n=1 Tax=Haplochromis burtoni TaxID=8153 RepID=A0A3Q2W4D7_HAPBU
ELLDADMSEMEVLRALKCLQINKTPGPDGFSVDYYKAFSNKLLTPLTNMIKEALKNNKLPEPLSLLNADYKILSKVIALRLEDIMTKIIHTDQTGFIKNRHGADNVRCLLHILNTAQ